MTNGKIITKTYTISKAIDNCLDCPNHAILPDPDPLDSFCHDDVKVVCTKGSSDKPRVIALAIRPYQARRESAIPDWCPL